MSMELFKLMTSPQIAHMPYQGSAEQCSEHLHHAVTKWGEVVTVTGARRVSIA